MMIKELPENKHHVGTRSLFVTTSDYRMEFYIDLDETGRRRKLYYEFTDDGKGPSIGHRLYTHKSDDPRGPVDRAMDERARTFRRDRQYSLDAKNHRRQLAHNAAMIGAANRRGEPTVVTE
ncbi:hypothetical protein ACFLQN_02535 [Candidatus Aenigmatarchaeota archaeon]